MGALITIVGIWVGMACIPASIAQGKGRGFGSWWLFGFLLWPVALIAALVISPDKATLDKHALIYGTGRKCPFCAEIIKPEAKACRYCGRDIPSPST